MTKKEIIEQSYNIAKQQYAQMGIDTDAVIEKMNEVVISLHCWQTDDVGGFETPDAELSGGGIQVTGNYPGKASSIEQMRTDLDKVLSLLPGKQRLNLHAIYGEFGGKLVDRNEISVEHFQGWIDWAKERGMGLDFNATCFSHPRAADGF
nr:L-rhamnose isomerase [Prolixibacteraceae bacterium]